MDIRNTLHNSLQLLSKQHTEETLGDRRNYLGASDIGYCPRKVILEKISPKVHDLTTLLRFQRGHMAEDIVAAAFTAAGFSNFERQVEVDISTDKLPALVHIDFVFTAHKKKIKSILEVKAGKIPDQPYSSWESQLYLQMGALAKKHPDYTIKGAVLSLDLNEGDVGFFNGYTPQGTLYNGLIKRAEAIWNDYQQSLKGQKIELKTEPGPLCGFCNHIRTCPRFAADDIPEMDDYITEFQELRELEKKYKEKVATQKKILLTMVNGRGNFRAGGYLLKKTTRTRQNLDMTSLGQFLSDNGTSISEFQEPSSFSFLDIKRAPQEVSPTN
jgi:CRISPR-associated exonuclease Cas4